MSLFKVLEIAVFKSILHQRIEYIIVKGDLDQVLSLIDYNYVVEYSIQDNGSYDIYGWIEEGKEDWRINILFE